MSPVSSTITIHTSTSTTPVPSNKLPYIFILDIDGTMVGNVKFQVTNFILRRGLEDAGIKDGPKSSECLDAYREDNRLVRPYFIQFLRFMNEKHPNSRFFIYTASEGVWAEQEIKWMEKLSGVKFMRPLFSRKDCIMDRTQGYTKSVAKVLPRIWRALSKDFPHLTKDDKKYIEAKRLLVVDNMPVFTDFQSQVILCPTYDYVYVENVLEGIPPPLLDHPAIADDVRNLEKDSLCISHKSRTLPDPMERAYAEHRWFEKATAAAIRVNRTYISDCFWRKLRKVFQKYDHQEVSKEMMQMIKETCLTKTKPAKK